MDKEEWNWDQCPVGAVYNEPFLMLSQCNVQQDCDAGLTSAHLCEVLSLIHI